MELPNIHFQDFPIEFKKINTEDFPNFTTQEKVIISPNAEGYINEELQVNIALEEKNTVVINAAVGQGKTYSIIEIIKRFFEADENYMIFVASPFVSLVQQYYSKLIGVGIPENQIYRYESIGTETHLDAWNSKIQIVTVNCLLGNPGEDKLLNSEAKRHYINYLSSKCEENNKKIVFIYDELHDAIYNFKEEYIFNLWKWRNNIHKNILLSATYNEASKVVIEYLAELTENKIQIIESERIRYPDKQSDLFLHYNPSKSYRSDNDGIVTLISDLIKREKNIDILSFSKSLADEICNNTDIGVGALFADAGIDIQNCTSDLDENVRIYRETPENRYDPSKCNVGTNFKTGVSIEKENHAFVIIMPPLGTKGAFRNKYGIFSGGINSVVQALARQRVKGEIHIVLPPPEKFDYESLNFQDEIKLKAFVDNYSLVQLRSRNSENSVKYYNLDSQDELLNEYYSTKLYGNIQLESEYVSSLDRRDKIRLEYPSFKLFKLEKGESYLSSEIKFFGKDLSSYITYCAITNQFVNCTLKDTNSKPPIYFKEDKVQYVLEKYYGEYMEEDLANSLYGVVNDRYKYFEFRNSLFLNFKVMYKASEQSNYSELKPFENKNFEKQFLAFFQRKFYTRNREFAKRFKSDTGYLSDAIYTRGEYFRANISQALYLMDRIESLNSETKTLVEAYSILEFFRNKLINNIQNITKRGQSIQYLENQPPSDFILEEELMKFMQMFQVLNEKDILIKNEIFDFKRVFNRQSDVEKIKKSFYSYLLEDFFITEDELIYPDGVQKRVKKVRCILELPNRLDVVNFITQDDLIFPDEYWESETKKIEFEEILKAVENSK